MPRNVAAKSVLIGSTKAMVLECGKDRLGMNVVLASGGVLKRNLDERLTSEVEAQCMNVTVLKERIQPRGASNLMVIAVADLSVDGGRI